MADDPRALMSALLALSREGRRLSDGELRLLLLYRSYETREGGASPGDELVADQLDVTVRTVERRRAALLEKGFLEQELRGPRPAAYRAILPGEAPTPTSGHDTRKPRHQRRDIREDPTQDPTQDPTSVSRASEDEYGEYGEYGTSSVGPSDQPAAPNVAKSTRGNGEPAPDPPWNARLAPLARDLAAGDERLVGRWLAWARGRDPDQAERVMRGTVAIRDRGGIPWCDRGVGCHPGVLDPRLDGQPLSRVAEAEYWRITRPPGAERGEGLKRVNT